MCRLIKTTMADPTGETIPPSRTKRPFSPQGGGQHERIGNEVVRKALIYYFSVIPAQAGIQQLAEPIRLGSGSLIRFGWNDG
jgi:hypothetical protein